MYARGGSTLSNFPVLIRLVSDANLSNNAKPDGGDICFYESNGGALLKHEIEYYTNGSLFAWIKMPALTFVAGENEIYMYYGYTASAAMQDSTKVWDTNFLGVWHLNETSGQVRDSTIFSKHSIAVSFGTGTQNTNGFIGGANFYSGAFDDYVQIPALTTLITGHPFTIEAWVNPSATGNYRTIAGYDGTHRIMVSATSAMLDQQDGNLFSDAGDVPDNTWSHVVIWCDGIKQAYYINGIKSSSEHNTVNCEWNQNFRIGQYDLANYPYKGFIDEFRISSNARSAGWINTSYSNQFSNECFYTINSEFRYHAFPSFTAIPSYAVVSIPILFSNTFAGYCSATNVIYNFAEGSSFTNSGSSVSNTVVFSFHSTGVKTNWITVTDNATPPFTLSNSLVLNVNDYVLPKIDLYWIPQEPIVGQYVRFIANSSSTYGAVTNWQIDFGAGSKYIWRQYMTNHPVAYRYPYSGEFVVCFSVVDQYGQSNELKLTNNVTDFGAQDVIKMPKRVFKYGRDFPLYFKFRLIGTARKAQLRVIHLNGMILCNLGFKEGFEGEDLLFTWNGKTQWNTYITYPPCFLRYDVYSEEGFIETVIQIIVVY